MVQTTSGSKYFLAPKLAPAVQKKAPPPRSSSTSNAKAKKALETVEKAKPGATVSLGFFNFGGSDDVVSNQKAGVLPRVVSQAPRGVPSLSRWRKNRDGSVTGFISGSRAYSDGESVTTSPITTDAVDGGLVQTTSGSRYVRKLEYSLLFVYD